MLGHVLQFNEAEGTGHIIDVEDNVYLFSSADVKGGLTLSEKQSVLFRPSSTRAFDVESVTFADRPGTRRMAQMLRFEGWIDPPWLPDDVYQASKRRIPSGLVAAFMALFGGVIGMHKFYLGYPGAGMAMILTSAAASALGVNVVAIMVAVVGIVEGLIYLIRSDDDFLRIYVLGRRPWF